MTNRTGAELAAVFLAVFLASACSSAAHTSPAQASGAHASAAHASAARAAAPAVGATCQQLSAVLSNGPDPDSDPVGYAEAQVLPLRQLSLPEMALRTVVNQLAGAYQQFFASNGKSSSAKEAVAVASKKLDRICPGAAS